MNVEVSKVHESKKLNIIKIAMCFRFIYRFNTIPIRIPDDRDSYFTYLKWLAPNCAFPAPPR